MSRFGSEISSRANQLLDRPDFTVSPNVTQIKLVVTSASKLGYSMGATRHEIYQMANRMVGLEICSAEVGPQLCLQYKALHVGRKLVVGMEPILDLCGNINVFSILAGIGSRWLYASCGNPNLVWCGDVFWVFALS